MADKTNTVDPQNGNVNYTGPTETCKGNHKGMPSRTEAYLPTDEKGHVIEVGNSNTEKTLLQ